MAISMRKSLPCLKFGSGTDDIFWPILNCLSASPCMIQVKILSLLRPLLGICIRFWKQKLCYTYWSPVILLLKLHQCQSFELSVKELIYSCDILKQITWQKFPDQFIWFCILNVGGSSQNRWSGINRPKLRIVLVSNSFFHRSSSGLSCLYTVYGIVFDEEVSPLPKGWQWK